MIGGFAMSNEKSTSKVGATRSGKPVIIFLCALLIVSWCFALVNGNRMSEQNKPQTVTGSAAEKIERRSADFMSFLCDLDFQNASDCLDHLDMADNLTSDLTKKTINAFSDSFLYEAENFDELRNSSSYEEIVQKTFDFIKENSSFEITGIKRYDDIYYVSVLFNCIESSDLLSKLTESTAFSNSFYVASSDSEINSEEDVPAESSDVFAEINERLDDILLNTEKEQISITLELFESKDTFKISDLTDMNFVKFFIQ